MHPTCKIRWIDDNNQPTGDDHPAIGYVWLPARTSTIAGRTIHLEASDKFPICQHHYDRLLRERATDPSMALWEFEPLNASQD